MVGEGQAGPDAGESAAERPRRLVEPPAGSGSLGVGTSVARAAVAKGTTGLGESLAPDLAGVVVQAPAGGGVVDEAELLAHVYILNRGCDSFLPGSGECPSQAATEALTRVLIPGTLVESSTSRPSGHTD